MDKKIIEELKKYDKNNILITKNNELKSRFKWTLHYLASGNNIFHLKSWTKSKGHYNLIDTEHDRMLEVLKTLGIKYIEGNDAPKGGAVGDYIKIISDKRNKIYKIIIDNQKEF